MPGFIAALLIIFLCSSASLAAISDDRTLVESTPSSSNEKTPTPDQSDTEIYRKIKDVADGAHHLQQTIHEIVFEVTRQNYAIASEPNVIGPMVIPAIPPPTGDIPIGIFFPPRKKYMTLYAEQTHNLLTMLIEESTSLPSSVEGDAVLSSKIVSLKQHIEKLGIEDDTMQKLMTGSSYNNLLIGKKAVEMSDEIDQMKKLLKDSEKEIHQDLKQQ